MNFLLELLSEEIPARMQAGAASQLAERFAAACAAASLPVSDVTADATPRRLWLTATVAAASAAASEERRGPKADAPPQAIEGFLRSTGLTRDQLEERDSPKGKFLYAMIASEGRAAAAILGEAIPEIVRAFQWPKSMRWGAESVSTASARWVRPLAAIIALIDGEVVPFSVHGVTSGRLTRGHRVHAPGEISVDSAATYAGQLRAAHVIAAAAERRALIEAGAAAAAAKAGLTIIPDAGLIAENAGLTEWPVPLLGRFDPAFLAVPREVIQLTMRTNQKYFACTDADGAMAPAFVCVANLEASDGGTAIVKGNERVLSARLADAKFFWDKDLAAVAGPGGLEVFTPKLADIVFHEKLGTVADKVERVAKLARWLVESGAVTSPPAGEVGLGAAEPGEGSSETPSLGTTPLPGPLQGQRLSPSPARGEGSLAALAERAARLCKADLVSATVGEFPEVQGIAGRYLALASGEAPEVADAIRDHYKPVGQGDDVPTAPVSVAVALADKLDSLLAFFVIDERPTGSKDPFALRRGALGIVSILEKSEIRVPLSSALQIHFDVVSESINAAAIRKKMAEARGGVVAHGTAYQGENPKTKLPREIVDFLADRLKVQQREAGVRHDLIDAVFALGGEDDLVRLLARVRALQAFVATDDGVNLLAGYKRAANILRIETAKAPLPSSREGLGEGASASEPSSVAAQKEEEEEPSPSPSLKREGSEGALAAALDAALPAAEAAIAAEDFTAAMAALAALRAPVDSFFDTVMVNDPDPAIRKNRLALLARFRDAVHKVADFSRIEG